MRNTFRRIAGLCLLGSAACAQQPSVAVKPQPPAEPQTEFRGMPFPPGAMMRPDESRPGVGRFMLRIPQTPQPDAPLYRMDNEWVGGVPYLRPEDVVSVEAVTGEAAAERFGVDASRTVIVFTTTWGQARERS